MWDTVIIFASMKFTHADRQLVGLNNRTWRLHFLTGSQSTMARFDCRIILHRRCRRVTRWWRCWWRWRWRHRWRGAWACTTRPMTSVGCWLLMLVLWVMLMEWWRGGRRAGASGATATGSWRTSGAAGANVTPTPTPTTVPTGDRFCSSSKSVSTGFLRWPTSTNLRPKTRHTTRHRHHNRSVVTVSHHETK